MAKIFVTNEQYDSNVIKVFLENDNYNADLCFYEVDNKYDAENKDEYWYFTNDKYEASAIIYWVKDKYNADLIVCKTNNKYDAQWNKSNKFVGRIG